ncbi:MAG: UvrD-helicase domain-containing protein [Patescibacteria group bacterium]
MTQLLSSELNESQRQAVLHRDGPLLVIAGAGTGKTRTITQRIHQLIESGVQPGQILAVTFTNKAAKEMLERVMKLNGVFKVGNRPFISTFHTLGAAILRENAAGLGLQRHFSIFDQDDSIALIKTALKEAALDPKRFNPKNILSTIAREKGKRITASRYAETVNETGRRGFWPALVAKIWLRYEEKLRAQGALDFDDLLLWPVELLSKEAKILENYHARWHYLLIDEYQDTNLIQYQLARLLAGPRQNICAVGDLDQSIYSWRGANCQHLLHFADDYPGAKIITLEENYRSTEVILAAANHIISKNFKRVEKNLFTRRAGSEKISLTTALDERQEAAAVARQAAALIQEGTAPEQIAVLYRANFQSRVLEEALLQAGLPYRVLGTRFFERREIKDVLAYLKAALNPDDLESFQRALQVPSRGLGKVALVKILAGQIDDLPAGQRQKFKDFKKLLTAAAAAAAQQPVAQVLQYIIHVSGLAKTLAAGGSDDRERLENIQELVSLARKYDELPPAESAGALLAEAALVSDQDTLYLERKAAINLMTVHAAKGLEFDRVFITGLEQSLFPHDHFGSPAGEKTDPDYDEEEERRLFYVALTRARDKLYLSYAETRTIYGATRPNQPSEFILDLDSSLFETQYLC